MQCIYRTSKKICNNERGLALVSALILGLIGMLMVASLLLMVDSGTLMSGSKKRYQMALNAAHGGMNFFAKEIIHRGLNGDNLSAMGSYGDLHFDPKISNTNMNSKLRTTGRLTDGTYPNVPLDATMTFVLPPGSNIAVNTAIVSTSRGNSGTSSNLLQGGGVVNNNSGTITPQHFPYIYQIETQGQGAVNENSRLKSLYAY